MSNSKALKVTNALIMILLVSGVLIDWIKTGVFHFNFDDTLLTWLMIITVGQIVIDEIKSNK